MAPAPLDCGVVPPARPYIGLTGGGFSDLSPASATSPVSVRRPLHAVRVGADPHGSGAYGPDNRLPAAENPPLTRQVPAIYPVAGRMAGKGG